MILHKNKPLLKRLYILRILFGKDRDFLTLNDLTIDMAFRARAFFLGVLVHDLYRVARECNHRIQHGEDFRLDDTVIYIPPVSPVRQNSGFAQYHQMLGNISLTKIKHGFHMANALFAFAQDFQNG